LDDPGFEMRLGRLFNEAPTYPDSALFAIEIESRLGRGWALRRALILAAGAVGGLVAVGQAVSQGLFARLDGFAHMAEAARLGLANLPISAALHVSALPDLPFGGEVMGLVLGFAALAGALLVGRSLEEL
jgi:hypothetical protein